MSAINFDEQFDRALEAGDEANATEARAEAVDFDPKRREIVLRLKNGSPFSVAIGLIPGLRDASDKDLSKVEITPSSEGLHWPTLDEDLSIPALVCGNYGPGGHDEAMFERLCAKLESSWFSDHDPGVVDRLA